MIEVKRYRKKKKTEWQLTTTEKSLIALGQFCKEVEKRRPMRWQGRKDYMQAVYGYQEDDASAKDPDAA